MPLPKYSARKIGLCVAALAFALDQSWKLYALYGLGFRHMAQSDAVSVLPFFNLVMLWNPGISYGLFAANSPEAMVFLATFQMIAAGVLTWWMFNVRKLWVAVSLGLVIGGALGNLTDRLVYGAVADFFHLHAFGRDFYVFNVADAAITMGVFGWMYDTVFHRGPMVRAGEENSP